MHLRTMATTTLTQPIQRNAFKRTFLLDVTAKVTFAETDLLVNGTVIRDFLRNKFGIADDINLPKLNEITIVSDSKNEKYNFTTGSASVFIDSNIYRYFEDSLKPRLDVIVSFLQALGINEVDSFSIKKRNFFQANAENAYQAWKIAIIESFKVDSIKALAGTPSISEKPFKITIEGTSDTEWGKISIPFMVNVPDKSNFRFQLDLEAVSNSIKVSELIERSAQMNDALFETFTGVVSDKLIDLMQQD